MALLCLKQCEWLAHVGASRWDFVITKNELGLDHYEVRSAASLVSTHHTGTVGSRCAICHSYPSSNYGRSIGGSKELKLLPWTLPEVKRLLWLLLWSTKPRALHCLALVNVATTKARANTAPCHYRRRHAQRTRPSEQLPLATHAEHTTYPTNLSDQQWKVMHNKLSLFIALVVLAQ